jgi:hypothetical protein
MSCHRPHLGQVQLVTAVPRRPSPATVRSWDGVTAPHLRCSAGPTTIPWTSCDSTVTGATRVAHGRSAGRTGRDPPHGRMTHARRRPPLPAAACQGPAAAPVDLRLMPGAPEPPGRSTVRRPWPDLGIERQRGDTIRRDARMLELLEPYRGHRGRVLRLLAAAGLWAPRLGPAAPARPATPVGGEVAARGRRPAPVSGAAPGSAAGRGRPPPARAGATRGCRPGCPATPGAGCPARTGCR